MIQKILLYSFIFLLTSCSKMTYLTEQGYGQMKLQWSGDKIEEVLKKKDVSEEHKRKIRLIVQAKNFFFDYLKVEPTKIYREVVFLKSEAVTYLVTASAYDEIKPLVSSFPFMGSFPYLGFFSRNSAMKYAKSLEKDQYYVYLRPVYAYSTLGHFEDKILSSFFYLDDVSMIETIYHELFHTLFFVKGEVDFNENLASFFAQKMVEKSSFLDPIKVQNHFVDEVTKIQLTEKMVELVQEYSYQLKMQKPKTKSEADTMLKSFIEKTIRPQIMQECTKLDVKIADCSMASKSWNNASFSAFLTYEKDQGFWKKWWEVQIGMSPKRFFETLVSYYDQYEGNGNTSITFESFLKSKISK